MALLIPSIENIKIMKVKPKEGELYLLEFLEKILDDSFEVYFNPYMNGDRPDIIIMKKGGGVMIIEVKDWNINSYELDERKNWRVKGQKNRFTIKSPISQVFTYKENLFDLHIEKLLEKKIKDIRKFNTVCCAVYFHNATQKELEDLLVVPYKEDRKYLDFLKYNINLIGKDSLTEDYITNILKKRYLISSKPSSYFTDDMYESIKRFIAPTVHLKEQGKKINYSQQQANIVYGIERNQIRVKGVVGSGKTTVLAGRAVESYKKTKGKVLVLTFNITLKNFIHDKINNVPEEFSWANFVILNYHFFIKSELNNLGIEIEPPPENIFGEEAISKYFEENYYSNIRLFKELNIKHKYDVILIDEVQDYKRPWLDIIKECFLEEGGDYILFGDVKQNIYNNTTENRDVSVNVRGVNELKRCFRSDFKIKDLAIEYQKEFYKNKYEIDNFNTPNTNQLELSFERNQQGSVNYMYLSEAAKSNEESIKALYTIIHENAINKGINPNDITILAQTIKFLRDFDAFYRYASEEKTNTMFETWELIYKLGFNFLGKAQNIIWLQKALNIVNFPNNKMKGTDVLSRWFTLYDLLLKYPDVFQSKINIFCNKYSISKEELLNFTHNNGKEIEAFKNRFTTNNMINEIKKIRDNKKMNFWFNSGTLKLSTVHSFKGWESELLFLIIEPLYGNANKFNVAFDEILYTGITRSRSNLIIINYGNQNYHEKLNRIVSKVKNNK